MVNITRYSPDFRIRINGEPLPPLLRASITSISFQDGLEGASSVDVSLANPELKSQSDPLFAEGNELSLSIGYAPRQTETVFVGKITGIEANFPAGGIASVRLTAHDQLQRLTEGGNDRAFRINIPTVGNFPLPDNVVTAMLAADNLLVPAIDPIGGALSVLMGLATYVVAPGLAQQGVRRQRGESDFEFLNTVAAENGWDMFIDHSSQPAGSVLRFKSFISDFTPVARIKYGVSLIEFTPRLSTVGDVAGVSSRIWIDSLKTEFVIVVSWDDERGAFKLSVVPGFLGDIAQLVGQGAGSKKTLSIKPVGFPQTLRQILTELLPRLNHRLAGSGSVVGDPRIKASCVVQLDGLGGVFDGLYRVTSATHTLDSSGYRTNFDARREVWFPSFVNTNAPDVLIQNAS